MQGPPPTSPTYMAPPIKKQRGGAADGPPPAGGGPPPPQQRTGMDPAQYRAQQLAQLKQGYNNRPNYGPPPGGAAGGPPRATPNVGFNPGARPPKTMMQMNQHNVISNNSNHSATMPGSGSNLSGGMAPPMMPGRSTAPNFARQSDLFPTAPKAATPAPTPVARRLDVSFQEAPPAASTAPPAATAAPPLAAGSSPAPASAAPPSLVPEASPPPASSHPSTMSSPEAPKEAPPKHVAFAPTPKTSKTPPATPGGGLMSSPEPVTSPPQTPFEPNSGSKQQPPKNAGHTPFPTQNRSSTNAGQTPYHPKDAVTSPGDSPLEPNKVSFAGTSTAETPFKPADTKKFAGVTPHPKASEQEQQAVPTANRREKLAFMRDVADTPPQKQNNGNSNRTVSFASSNSHEESAELRLQKKLTEENRLKEQYLRQIAELQDEITDLKHNNASKVRFMPTSPARSTPLTPSLTPQRRRTATPHPKLAEGELEGIDKQFLEQAAEDVPYKFEIGPEDEDSGVDALFVVRRPYGYGDMDHELWFAAGEKNAKLYHRDAAVEKEESIEIAVQIGVDDSVLLLYGEANVRHQNTMEGTWKKFGNVYETGESLGTVAYIDTDADEKEYSLDKLFEQAIDIRQHYCASLRNMAIALQRRAQENGGDMASPRTNGVSAPPTPVGEVSPKVDACVGTEDVKFPPAGGPRGEGKTAQEPPAVEKQQRRAPPPPPPDEPVSDVFSVLVGLMLSPIWFIFTFIWRVLYDTVKLGFIIVLLSCVYLWMIHNFKWTGVAPPLHYYYNPPGIV